MNVHFSKGTNRSSCSVVVCKIVALKNFVKFLGKHLCRSLVFRKEDS